ncbi:MAG: hypothetical protein CVV48_05565 [Spirochaetae bacterium HGW-Spirochaetae-4]|nr:MAG: hypothetical protein CVV52_18540 [Spirochaetae bacterium HGW-Spirochaetae-8]PKL21926.1 MAG: hypothetical protein CVV48_05565 [Spirochaetae bacterium HGW-Spirochaetae-4]
MYVAKNLSISLDPCYTEQTMPDEKRKPIIHVIPAKRHFKRFRVALYCRVSTQMERQLQSLSAQMDFEKEDILGNLIGNMSVPTPISSRVGPSAPVLASRASWPTVKRESCSIGFQKELFIITYLIAILEKLWL